VTFWKNNFGQQLLFVSNKVIRFFLVSVKKCIVFILILLHQVLFFVFLSCWHWTMLGLD
jgi:hypothetical protein